MDGCNVLPETQFVGTRLRVDITRVLSVGGNLPPCGAAGERSEFNIKPPLGAPLLIFPRGYLLKSFPRVDTSARQRGIEIRVFPLLCELPKAIQPHLPVCQLYRWQLGPSMWTSPTTKSLDTIVVTALRVGFPGESHGPATCGFACNCPEPEAWTTETWRVEMTTALQTTIFVWIVRFWLPKTRLLKRPKADEARLMRLWISFERSPENERLEPKEIFFGDLKLIPTNGKT